MTTKQVDKIKNTDTDKKDNTDQDNSATTYINKNKTSWSDLIERGQYQFNDKVGLVTFISDILLVMITFILSLAIVNPPISILGYTALSLSIFIYDYTNIIHSLSALYMYVVSLIVVSITHPISFIFAIIIYYVAYKPLYKKIKKYFKNQRDNKTYLV